MRYDPLTHIWVVRRQTVKCPHLLVISVPGDIFFLQVTSSAPRRHVFNYISAAPLFRRFRALTFIHWHDQITISRDRRWFSQTPATPLTFIPTDYQFEDITSFSASSFWLSITFLITFPLLVIFYMRVGANCQFSFYELCEKARRNIEVLTEMKKKRKN